MQIRESWQAVIKEQEPAARVDGHGRGRPSVKADWTLAAGYHSRMRIEHLGSRPRIHASARVSPNAIIYGDVTIGANCSVGFGAVLTGESGPITIGEDCVVMDTAVLRGVQRNPLKIGNRVLVGPRAYLSGCEVEDNIFLATGATVFNGAMIGTGSEVRINGVVHLRTVLPPNTTVPIGWIAVVTPSRFLRRMNTNASGQCRSR